MLTELFAVQAKVGGVFGGVFGERCRRWLGAIPRSGGLARLLAALAFGAPGVPGARA